MPPEPLRVSLRGPLGHRRRQHVEEFDVPLVQPSPYCRLIDFFYAYLKQCFSGLVRLLRKSGRLRDCPKVIECLTK
jgi:hypothetical protein